MNISLNPLASVRERTVEDLAIFDGRFLRCRKLLVFIASRVLGGREGTDEALQNCRFTASRNRPRFEHEGAFRSWLVRVLIDEALAILRQAQQTETDRLRGTDCFGGSPQERVPQRETVGSEKAGGRCDESV